jgi:hypothetical protein
MLSRFGVGGAMQDGSGKQMDVMKMIMEYIDGHDIADRY